MSTRKQAAQTVDYWASQNEESVEEILATLEFLDDESRDLAFEQLAHLIDDADILRQHAQNVRTNRGYNNF